MEVGIINYGSGNIGNVTRSLRALNVNYKIINKLSDFKNIDKIILPGQGAFKSAIENLKKSGVYNKIIEHNNDEKPILAICLGMQLLLDYSEEFGHHKGLGIIHGSVTKFTPSDGSKVPHTGWNSIKLPEDSNEHFWSDQILNEISPGTDYYFVHSFMVKVNQAFNSVAETTYGGVRFSSIIRHKNVYGCQFHPEKSGITGSKFLENFIKI